MDQSIAPALRHDGFTPLRQRIFLEALATEGFVRRAASASGMSHEAAYQLRRSAAGAAFRLGWDAALLLARAALADALMERALEGQEEVIERDADSGRRIRHRHDNRLALSLLARLDRFADDGHAAHADARAIAGAWDAFLGLVAEGTDTATLAAFLAAHRIESEGNTNPSGPCQLHEDDDGEQEFSLREAYLVWHHGPSGEFRTNFPPPPGFKGFQTGDPDTGHRLHSSYQRALSALEAKRERARIATEMAEMRARAHDWRKQWFAIEDGEEAGGTACAPCSGLETAVS